MVKEKIISYYPYKKEINKMIKEDQDMRFSGNWDSSVDKRNFQKVKDIFEKIGVPTISKVGEKASQSFIILVIHQDKNVSFQETFLKEAKKEKEDLRLSTLAHLEDRVLVNKGMKQIYGSQVNSNTLKPYPIKDEKNVDKLRAEVGLEPLDEYLKGFENEDIS